MKNFITTSRIKPTINYFSLYRNPFLSQVEWAMPTTKLQTEIFNSIILRFPIVVGNDNIVIPLIPHFHLRQSTSQKYFFTSGKTMANLGLTICNHCCLIICKFIIPRLLSELRHTGHIRTLSVNSARPAMQVPFGRVEV